MIADNTTADSRDPRNGARVNEDELTRSGGFLDRREKAGHDRRGLSPAITLTISNELVPSTAESCRPCDAFEAADVETCQRRAPRQGHRSRCGPSWPARWRGSRAGTRSVKGTALGADWLSAAGQARQTPPRPGRRQDVGHPTVADPPAPKRSIARASAIVRSPWVECSTA